MEVFMDDYSVFGNSFGNCLSRVDKMLKRCEDTNLCLNWEKSHFMVKEGIVLGHKIFKNGIEVNNKTPKVDVIAKLPHPTTIKGVWSFLSHAGIVGRRIVPLGGKLDDAFGAFRTVTNTMGVRHTSSDPLGSNLVVSFPSGTRNKIFDPGIFIGVQSMIFLSLDEFSFSFIYDPPLPVIDTLLPFSSENENKVFNTGILASEEISPPYSSHRGFKASKLSYHKARC
ncbi:hypothetical protein Tco_0533417 [Tanacetum coccineum]